MRRTFGSYGRLRYCAHLLCNIFAHSVYALGRFQDDYSSVAAAIFGVTFVLKFKPYVADRFSGWRHVWEHTQDNLGYQQARVLTYMASVNATITPISSETSPKTRSLSDAATCFKKPLPIPTPKSPPLAVAVGAMFIYARAITTRSRSTFYSISACCAAGLFVVQLSLNVFGATDVLPLTGVTFPFVSAGGSSIMSCWGLVAFIKAADERTYSVKR